MLIPHIDTSKARIYFANGEVEHFRNQVFAFAVWLMMPKGDKVAFRGRGDTRPVPPWDRRDRMPRRRA